jgi:uncharacterized protein YebE (UPF0316 family)
MKSNNALVGISVLCLALAVLASALVWSDVTFAVKVGMYAFGFSSGVAAGVLIVKQKDLNL